MRCGGYFLLKRRTAIIKTANAIITINASYTLIGLTHFILRLGEFGAWLTAYRCGNAWAYSTL